MRSSMNGEMAGSASEASGARAAAALRDDRRGEVLRTVTAKSFRETWTQHDPELAERDYLPKERRRDFYRPSLALRQ